MKYLVVIAFVIVYFLFGLDMGYTAHSAWWTHFSYSFQHGSLMHLFINSVGFIAIYGLLERFIHPVKFLTAAYFIAVVSSFVCTYPTTVVGASGVIYAMIGMYLALLLFKRVHYRYKSDLLIFILSVAVFFVIGFLKQNMAGMLHFVCLIMGVVFGSVCLKFFKKCV